MSRAEPAWLQRRKPCPFYPTGRCIFDDKCNFIHDGHVSSRRNMRTAVPAYRRTPENSVDSLSSEEEDHAEEHHIDEHSAAAPSLVFSSIYGPRPNSINRLGLADVDLPVSPESLPNTPSRRPSSYHSAHGLVNITSPAASRPLSSSLGIGIGGRAQGGLAEVFAAVATAQAQATALPPSTATSLPSPLSLSPRSPPNEAQEIVIKDDNFTLEEFPFKLALSDQSSLILNRTRRRGSSAPQRSRSISSTGSDKVKKPTNLSAPERFSVTSVPRHVGDESFDRPSSRSMSGSSLIEEEEGEEIEADDEDEDGPDIVDEQPSFESLQPYPRDVSTEPSPDPTRQKFVPPVPPVPAPPPAPAPPVSEESGLRRPTRKDSARHIEHELLLDELEERLGVEPRRKRAKSSAAATVLKSAAPPVPVPAPRSEPEITRRNSMGKGVDMNAARGMLSDMFAKRAQVSVQEEEREEEQEQDQSFLPVDWDVGSMVFDGRTEDGASDVAGAQNDTSDTKTRVLSETHVQPAFDVHDPTSDAHEIDSDSYSDIGSDEEPTEDFAELLNDRVVLATPMNVVFRREIARETSLPSRTASLAGTPRNMTLIGTPKLAANGTLSSGTPKSTVDRSQVETSDESVSKRGSGLSLKSGSPLRLPVSSAAPTDPSTEAGPSRLEAVASSLEILPSLERPEPSSGVEPSGMGVGSPRLDDESPGPKMSSTSPEMAMSNTGVAPSTPRDVASSPRPAAPSPRSHQAAPSSPRRAMTPSLDASPVRARAPSSSGSGPIVASPVPSAIPPDFSVSSRRVSGPRATPRLSLIHRSPSPSTRQSPSPSHRSLSPRSIASPRLDDGESGPSLARLDHPPEIDLAGQGLRAMEIGGPPVRRDLGEEPECVGSGGGDVSGSRERGSVAHDEVEGDCGTVIAVGDDREEVAAEVEAREEVAEIVGARGHVPEVEAAEIASIRERASEVMALVHEELEAEGFEIDGLEDAELATEGLANEDRVDEWLVDEEPRNDTSETEAAALAEPQQAIAEPTSPLELPLDLAPFVDPILPVLDEDAPVPASEVSASLVRPQQPESPNSPRSIQETAPHHPLEPALQLESTLPLTPAVSPKAAPALGPSPALEIAQAPTPPLEAELEPQRSSEPEHTVEHHDSPMSDRPLVLEQSSQPVASLSSPPAQGFAGRRSSEPRPPEPRSIPQFQPSRPALPSPEPEPEPEPVSDLPPVLELPPDSEPEPVSEPIVTSGVEESLRPRGSMQSHSSLLLELDSLPADLPLQQRALLPEPSSFPGFSLLPGRSLLSERHTLFDHDTFSERSLSFERSLEPTPTAESGELPEVTDAPEPQEARRFSMVDRSEHSERSVCSSLSEIPSISELAPLATFSDILPQSARTPTADSDLRAASEPTSKSRPRSQLKPLRLSMMYGLGTPPANAVITPISANTVTPTPTQPHTAIAPTPTAMYPTPASPHSIQLPASQRPTPQSASSLSGVEDTIESAIGGRESLGPGSVSWFGSKRGSRQASLSVSMRESLRQSVHGSDRGSAMHSMRSSSPVESIPPSAEAERPPPQQAAAPLSEDEDIRPLPRIWDDDEMSLKSGSVRQRTLSTDDVPIRNSSLPIPVFDVPAEEPALPKTPAIPETSVPPKTPDWLDSSSRYPAFVNVGGTSPRFSDGRSPLVSPSIVPSTPSAQATPVKPPPPPRSRKWADTSNEESIGSLPVFDAPAPSAQPADVQPPIVKEANGPPAVPRSRRRGGPRYMQIPNTAPLSISPRRVSPSIMQREQEEGTGSGSGSYEDGSYSQDERMPYSAPPVNPLQLRMRMPGSQGSASPWMADYFTKSPSSLHSSQPGSMHSASGSLSNVVKVTSARQSIVGDKQLERSALAQVGTFGNPGPGPSTMKTYSERRQSSEGLGSPIVLQTSAPEPRTSLHQMPEQGVPSEPIVVSRRPSKQMTIDTTPRKPEEPRLTISLEDSSVELVETGKRVASHSVPTQSPLRSQVDEASPPRKAPRQMTMTSPSPVRHTPLSAPSPLQILRRNMMARTSPESPRFLSPQTRLTSLPESRPSRHQHHSSLAPTPTMLREEIRNAPMSAPGPRDRRSLTPSVRFMAPPSRPGSPTQSVQSTLSQTKPLLFFAIAKNSAQEVERLLQDGEVQPNDKAGPEDLPALAFTLANEQLSDKTQIVKSLLSHGADPASVLHRKSGSGQFDDTDLALTTRIEQGMNPAIRYYLNRKRMTIPAPQAELLEKNNFGGLTRAGFSIIGQDAALDELIRVVAGHCRRQTLNPLVIVFSGGPGCGKSLLASKIGPLLHVPTFTVNMTNLRNESSLFNYISMTTKAGNPQIPLVDFLKHNEGQRCVVVLEEIEKAADKTVWHSLLMPWEWGKATVIPLTTNEQMDIDTSKVIWIATSNSGDDATLKFFAERSRPAGGAGYDRGESALARLAQGPRPNDNFTRKDYLQLTQAVRKRLGELLGSSIISRVSSVLPFLPFTEEEVYALASESLSAMRADQKADQNVEDVEWEELLQQAVGEYIPGEGARSVHRAVQRAFDEITEW